MHASRAKRVLAGVLATTRNHLWEYPCLRPPISKMELHKISIGMQRWRENLSINLNQTRTNINIISASTDAQEGFLKMFENPLFLWKKWIESVVLSYKNPIQRF